MKQDPPNTISLCFDLQQVQYLPRITIGEAFYKRQLPFYSFCVVPPGKNKSATFFTWNATEGHRGSEEIASALLHYLNKEKSKWAPGITKVRLFCDGCGGQNKNRHIIQSLAFWLANSDLENLQSIEMFFPVRGHSYLPADRVFGRVEKQMRRIKEVILPSEYNAIYREHGVVKEVNSDWLIRKFKDLASYMNACTGIQEAKRVIIKKMDRDVGFKFEFNYFHNDKTKKLTSIMKSKKYKLSMLILPAKFEGPIQLQKKLQDDINYLMERRFGCEWRVHHPFYAKLVSKCSSTCSDDDHENENDCQCNDEEDLLL